MTIAVLGAGAVGQSMAADLTLAGYDINLFEIEKFKDAIKPVIERGGIEITGMARNGFAEIPKVTTKIEEAVEGVSLINIVVPAFAHKPFFKLLIPHLEDGQAVMIWPGNYGALVLRKILTSLNISKGVIIGEGVSSIYACRISAPAEVFVRRVKEASMPVAGLPARNTSKIVKSLKKIWPQIIPGNTVLEIDLNNVNHVAHPPAMILNAARIEKAKGTFNMDDDIRLNPPPCIQRVTEAIDKERIEITRAFGFKCDLSKRLYIPGRVAETPKHSPDRAPSSMLHRYLNEDVPYGSVPIASFGNLLGIATPVTNAIISLASVINRIDYASEGISIDKLGFAGLDAKEITKSLS